MNNNIFSGNIKEYYEKDLLQYIEHTKEQLEPLENELDRRKHNINDDPDSHSDFWKRVHTFYFRDNILVGSHTSCTDDVFTFIDNLPTGSESDKKLYLNYLRISHRKMELFCNAYELDRGFSPIKLARERSQLKNKLADFEQLYISCIHKN
jgi:hypothetical protein